jgi:hypothetical protein
VGDGERECEAKRGSAPVHPRIAPVILDFFLVPVDLGFDTIDHQVHGRQEFFVTVARHKVVLVFGIDLDFNVLENLVLKIHRDFDHGDPVEIMEKLFRFFPYLILMLFTQVPMSGGDFDLHSRKPPTLVEAASFLADRASLQASTGQSRQAG